MDLKFKKITEKIGEKADIPIDIVKNLPRIQISGLEEIIIENHRGIISFESECVEVDSSVGKIRITGSNLEILFMGSATIIVGGKFKGVEYKGGNW